jgi:hypothetical protein
MWYNTKQLIQDSSENHGGKATQIDPVLIRRYIQQGQSGNHFWL